MELDPISKLKDHIFYQFGEISGYLEKQPFDDYIALILRNIRMGSGGDLSFTNRLDANGYLKKDLNGFRELKKSEKIQNFVNGINDRCPVYQKLSQTEYIDVYRSLTINAESYQNLIKNLTSVKSDNTRERILPHPLPFSVSWSSELSEVDWSYNNLTLKIQLPHQYPYLALSCPHIIDICNMEPDKVEKWLGRVYNKLPLVLNQSQLELLVMPSYFQYTGEYKITNMDNRKNVLITVKPVLMREADQRIYLHAELITWP